MYTQRVKSWTASWKSALTPPLSYCEVDHSTGRDWQWRNCDPRTWCEFVAHPGKWGRLQSGVHVQVYGRQQAHTGTLGSAHAWPGRWAWAVWKWCAGTPVTSAAHRAQVWFSCTSRPQPQPKHHDSGWAEVCWGWKLAAHTTTSCSSPTGCLWRCAPMSLRPPWSASCELHWCCWCACTRRGRSGWRVPSYSAGCPTALLNHMQQEWQGCWLTYCGN